MRENASDSALYVMGMKIGRYIMAASRFDVRADMLMIDAFPRPSTSASMSQNIQPSQNVCCLREGKTRAKVWYGVGEPPIYAAGSSHCAKALACEVAILLAVLLIIIV